MRIPRVLLIACPLLLGACGMIAGLDGYTESDGLTADGGPQQDASSAGDAAGFVAQGEGGSSSGDAGNFQIIEAGDAALSHDTGPASSATCQIIHNGNNCARVEDGGNCCSGACDETGSCSGNCIKSAGGGCNPNMALVALANPPYWVEDGNCCLGQYCQLKASSSIGFGMNPSGNCTACIANGAAAPKGTIQDNFAGKPRNVVYRDGCCSGNVDNSGNCK